MTVEQHLREAAEQLKKNPKEYIERLMQFTDRVLERKLDIVREQKQMAYDQKKKESFELFHVKEDLIIKVRLMKSENETEEKPARKPRKKKLSEERTEEFQNNSEQTDNYVTEDTQQTADKSDSDKKNVESKQLTLDF